MSETFTGHCLCGNVAFESSSEPVMQANCHCDDCRRAAGAAYVSYAFIPKEALTITKGETASYEHAADSGSVMVKRFCANCGSHLFGENSANASRIGVRVGAIDDASWFQPQVNVFASSKIPSTPLDPNIKSFDKMPG
jgi:hypothetical protein